MSLHVDVHGQMRHPPPVNQQQPRPPHPQQPPMHHHLPPQPPHPSTHAHLSHHPPLPQIHTLPPPQQPTPADISLQAGKMSGRKRKKAEDPDDAIPGSSTHSQPPARRLRRLHEACARCRSKKIKCDSKLPSCSACTAANVECNQEDRHRQTLKPRGYTDMVESHLAKCILVLEKYIPNFRLADIDPIMERQGIHLPPNPSAVDPETGGVVINPALGAVLSANAIALGVGAPTVKTEPVVPTLSAAPSIANGSGGGPASLVVSGLLGTARGSESASEDSTVYEDRRPHSVSGSDVKGQDPHSNDLSSASGLIKAFGVSRAIVKDLPKAEGSEGEDVLGGVRLDDDAPLPQYPKAASQWTNKPLLRRSGVSINIPPVPTPLPPPHHNTSPNRAPTAPHSPSTSSTSVPRPPPLRRLAFRMPKNRELTDRVVRKYFTALNPHRPVFVESEFFNGLNALYDSVEDDGMSPPRSNHARSNPAANGASVPPNPQDDPGFLCSVYFVLALGRLGIENERMHIGREGGADTMQDYPTHEEFFELALAVKPDLRVTISSLQALILLQWYLYTERHGRTLWRLVGNLVRIGVELGLHHDPSEQGNTFSPAECELRNRLWWIILIHDRGTSVQLGRPLAIADADFNTPFPKRYSPHGIFSEHFEHSPHLTAIQGDIINALYRPGNHKQTADQVVRHATRITKGLGAFSRCILGTNYRPFFEGTEDWLSDQKIALVTQMTEDQGLTLLKYGIARILLLRALFTSAQLSADARRRALKDAVITSHNILAIQNQLTSFPSLAFFVSPIPMHIAAMVILYGVISECDALSFDIAREDVCSALHIVPLFRWRWNRKDDHGSHPLIVRLAQKVFGQDVLHFAGPLGPPLLIPEWDWTTGQKELPPPSPIPSHNFPTYSHFLHEHSQQHQPQGLHQQPHGPIPANDMTSAIASSSTQVPPYLHQGHSRQLSGENGIPTTPVDAMPGQRPSPDGMSGVMVQPQARMMVSSASPPEVMHHQVNHSPSSVQSNLMEQPNQPPRRFNDVETKDLVPLLYPPPLAQAQMRSFYDGDASLDLALQQDISMHPQMHMMNNQMHVSTAAHNQPSTTIPPPHHSSHHMHPGMQNVPNGYPSNMIASQGPSIGHPQQMMYANMTADYTPSSAHYVQEEYDGKPVLPPHVLAPDTMMPQNYW